MLLINKNEKKLIKFLRRNGSLSLRFFSADLLGLIYEGKLNSAYEELGEILQRIASDKMEKKEK